MASRFPYPLEKGDKLRLFHQIKALNTQHEVVLCSLHQEEVDAESYEQVAKFCHKIYLFRFKKIDILLNFITGFFSKTPFSVLYFTHSFLQKKINRVIAQEQPDHIYCQLIRCAEYVKHISSIPKTLDYMDDFSTIMMRRANSSWGIKKWLFSKESKKIFDYQQTIQSYFDNQLIISTADQQSAQFLYSNLVRVIPNGVDLNYFKINTPPVEKEYDIVFVGNMGYHPNVEAAKFLAQKIAPLLKEKIPNIKILIAGNRPSKGVLALQSSSIHVTGWLDDVRIAYLKSKIMVVPNFLGAGQQNKIMEAMAMGLPCVTTHLVNSSYQALDNEQIMIADDAISFVNKIVDLKKDKLLYEKVSQNGLKFVHSKYSWAHYGEQLLSIFEKN